VIWEFRVSILSEQKGDAIRGEVFIVDVSGELGVGSEDWCCRHIGRCRRSEKSYRCNIFGSVVDARITQDDNLRTRMCVTQTALVFSYAGGESYGESCR
jgi:hypothetical protein